MLTVAAQSCDQSVQPRSREYLASVWTHMNLQQCYGKEFLERPNHCICTLLTIRIFLTQMNAAKCYMDMLQRNADTNLQKHLWNYRFHVHCMEEPFSKSYANEARQIVICVLYLSLNAPRYSTLYILRIKKLDHGSLPEPKTFSYIQTDQIM